MAEVLVTGATGFLGIQIVRRLVNKEFSVVGLKRPSSDLWRISDLREQAEFLDIDLSNVNEVFEGRSIDVVIHAATSYGRAGESLSEIVQSNLMLPLKVLEVGIEHGISAFLNADTFYSVQMTLPFGLQNYVRSKSDFVTYGSQLSSKTKIPFVNLQIEHMFGPRDTRGKLIPQLIQAFLHAKPEIELTSGVQMRDFIFVDDVAYAFEVLINNHIKARNLATHYEVGHGKAFSLREFAEKALKLCGADTTLKFGALNQRDGEIMSSHANNHSLKELGWAPNYNLDRGLIETIEFEKSRMEV
jgi:nucleoside-diphosphate-sugar epimerase